MSHIRQLSDEQKSLMVDYENENEQLRRVVEKYKDEQEKGTCLLVFADNMLTEAGLTNMASQPIHEQMKYLVEEHAKSKNDILFLTAENNRNEKKETQLVCDIQDVLAANNFESCSELPVLEQMKAVLEEYNVSQGRILQLQREIDRVSQESSENLEMSKCITKILNEDKLQDVSAKSTVQHLTLLLERNKAYKVEVENHIIEKATLNEKLSSIETLLAKVEKSQSKGDILETISNVINVNKELNSKLASTEEIVSKYRTEVDLGNCVSTCVTEILREANVSDTNGTNVKEQVSALVSKNIDLVSNLESMKEKIKEYETDVINNNLRVIEDTKKELDAKRKDCEVLERKVAILETEGAIVVKAHQDVLEENEQLSSKVDFLQVSVKEWETKVLSLNEQVSNMKSVHDQELKDVIAEFEGKRRFK